MRYQRQCVKCGEESRIEVKYIPKIPQTNQTLNNGIEIKVGNAAEEHLDMKCALCGYAWKSLTFEQSTLVIKSEPFQGKKYYCARCQNVIAFKNDNDWECSVCGLTAQDTKC